MTEKNYVNKTGFLSKAFIPEDQTIAYKTVEENAAKMCDDFLKEHPEYEEVTREIKHGYYSAIESCYSRSMNVIYALCLFKVK